MSLCACGSQKKFSECCEPYLKGKKKAETAEALMRSRYTAFTTHDVDYIYNTHHESTRKELDKEGIRTWATSSEWEGLEIRSCEKGGVKDTEGKVEFIARFNLNGSEQAHHELSSFKKENGEWFFVDGSMVNKTYRRETEKVGRNDPCPCGSGKKAKKCCLS